MDKYKNDNGCLTPMCKTDNYKCPNWLESHNGDLDRCALPKFAAVTECPYLREMLVKQCKENKQ